MAVKIFAQNQSVNLGAELGVAVGPLGRAATGNLNAGPGGMPAPAYAYAHSKGLFAGISVEGSIGKCSLIIEKMLSFCRLSFIHELEPQTLYRFYDFHTVIYTSSMHKARCKCEILWKEYRRKRSPV